MNIERSLVLNRFFHNLFGAERFDDLRRALKEQEEGPGLDGHSRFYHVLVGRSGIKLDLQTLARYDLRIIEYEARLAKNRLSEPFKAFKYFQYLALLYTEMFLDRLTENPTAFLQELETFRKSKADFTDIPGFSPDDLRRLAFFMATGSGKTLLLHVNIWQVLHYLKSGKHPLSLVRRSDGRAEFDNILLITPGEGLSAQHLVEFEDSGLEAGRFQRGNHQSGLFAPRVQVIEIHKLSKEPSGEGVSVPIAELGARNLIIVDEGHKGTGSEARTWKNRQETLGKDGFILEYSATFAQAIGAANRKVQEELLSTYGKSILFDYSYRYFYGDGYGKTFRVLNLKKASADKAHDLMLGGLLIFYQQAMLHRSHGEEARIYNIEKPLWVLLGTSVSRKRPDEKDTTKTADEERTDVGEVVAFLRRFLEDQDWAQERIAKTIAGKSGFSELDSGNDLFQRYVKQLEKEQAETLYRRICRELFNGSGGLEVVEIKRSGEIGLRVTAASGKELPYFGIINIGDVADFRKYLQEKLKIEVKQDVINDSLFERISSADSPINMLIGAKKFIEGWSSWRVSSMGLMRIGKGEGSQVIQLFGRGVRLKGKDKSLRRSHALGGAPDWLESLETLYITGWNADYLQTFRQMLEREDLAKELSPLRIVQMELPLWTYIPQTLKGFDCSAETWVLSDDGPRVKLDLLPQVVSLGPGGSGATEQAARAGREKIILPQEPPYPGLLDIDRLHADLVEYKVARGYSNVFIACAALRNVLDSRCELRMLEEEGSDPEKVYRAASRALNIYLDKFVRLRERQAESAHAEPGRLVKERQITYEYRITVHTEGEGERLYKEIKALLEKFAKQERELLKDAGEPLPRLHLDWHLFNPLLFEGGKEWQDHVSISPPPLVKSERKLVEDLRAFWAINCKSPEYRDIEVCLLRNLPKVGVGMFFRSSFYPDFILWIRNKNTKSVCVVFLDPHGLHHEGIVDNDRFAAIEKLRALSVNRKFKTKRIELDGYILAPADTSLDKIPGAAGKSWDDMEKQYPLLWQEGNYVGKIFASLP
ncbi:MAG: DEAD/DEAH box helicase family protein [Proteobacteria bacterium]|nr:DEAD/DEAH box helicase family protein [Pseudomonadota bacterium]